PCRQRGPVLDASGYEGSTAMLDGVADWLSVPIGVDTAESFSVAAWMKADELTRQGLLAAWGIPSTRLSPSATGSTPSAGEWWSPARRARAVNTAGEWRTTLIVRRSGHGST